MKLAKKFIVNSILKSHIFTFQNRAKLYKLMGINVSGSEVRAGAFFNSELVQIEPNCFINYFAQFHSGYDENGTIVIQEGSFIGMNVTFCTISHEIGGSEQRASKNNIYQPIKVEKGCWIGANSLILPGVTIGKGCIIAAGSVVTKSCVANGLYAGVPAVRVRDLNESDALEKVSI